MYMEKLSSARIGAKSTESLKKTLVFERVKSGTKNRANGAVIPKIAPAGGVNILPGPVATIIEVGPGRAEKKSFRAAGLSGQARNHL